MSSSCAMGATASGGVTFMHVSSSLYIYQKAKRRERGRLDANAGFDASNEISGFSRVPGSGEARFRVFFDWTAADFLDSYPGFHLDSYLDAAIPGL